MMSTKDGKTAAPSVKGLRRVPKAVALGAWKLRDQRRKDADASPYINHPLALAEVLPSEGKVTDPVVLAAALLHDTVEDTEATVEELAGASQFAGVLNSWRSSRESPTIRQEIPLA